MNFPSSFYDAQLLKLRKLSVAGIEFKRVSGLSSLQKLTLDLESRITAEELLEGLELLQCHLNELDLTLPTHFPFLPKHAVMLQSVRSLRLSSKSEQLHAFVLANVEHVALRIYSPKPLIKSLWEVMERHGTSWNVSEKCRDPLVYSIQMGRQ
jgi:hypothetical protein